MQLKKALSVQNLFRTNILETLAQFSRGFTFHYPMAHMNSVVPKKNSEDTRSFLRAADVPAPTKKGGYLKFTSRIYQSLEKAKHSQNQADWRK